MLRCGSPNCQIPISKFHNLTHPQCGTQSAVHRSIGSSLRLSLSATTSRSGYGKVGKLLSPLLLSLCRDRPSDGLRQRSGSATIAHCLSLRKLHDTLLYAWLQVVYPKAQSPLRPSLTQLPTLFASFFPPTEVCRHYHINLRTQSAHSFNIGFIDPPDRALSNRL